MINIVIVVVLLMKVVCLLSMVLRWFMIFFLRYLRIIFINGVSVVKVKIVMFDIKLNLVILVLLIVKVCDLLMVLFCLIGGCFCCFNWVLNVIICLCICLV